MQAFGGAISHLSEMPVHLMEKYGFDPREFNTGRIPGRNPVKQPVGDVTRVNTTATGNAGPGIGTLNYDPTSNQSYSASQLPQVTDPDKTMGNVARSQHERYIRNFRGFEEALIAARDDTSLIDAAREDAPEQARIAREVAERQRSRYGLTQTAVEARESERASQRGEAINLAGGLNEARLAQRDANTRLLSDLINIGQGVNRSSLSQLGAAGENAVARKNAYQQAKSAHKQQTYSMIGSAGAMLAAFLI
jgi:hypothetical protein|tara:strand:+ start:12708 stop:13457 length:750 start_codon:yes stop_codon:yes gene_type:complete